MGLFSVSKGGKKLSQKEIRKALYGISGVDSRERDQIMEALHAENDFGGVSEFELNRTLRKLIGERVISRSQATIIKRKFFK